MGRPIRTLSATLFAVLPLAFLLLACSRGASPTPRPSPDSAASGGTPVKTAQGIAGVFEALGGARLPDPRCETLSEEARRDSCERAFLARMTSPLRGEVIIRPQAAPTGPDSLVFWLDSLGGYRASLPPGAYSVCVRAEGLEDYPHPCQDSVVVKPGAYTPYSRPFPMP